jgi:hypothetical protein
MLSWTDLKISSWGGRGRERTWPVDVPMSMSVAGGVIVSDLVEISLDVSTDPENGDQAIEVMVCRMRSGLGLRDWVAAFPGVIGR